MDPLASVYQTNTVMRVSSVILSSLLIPCDAWLPNLQVVRYCCPASHVFYLQQVLITLSIQIRSSTLEDRPNRYSISTVIGKQLQVDRSLLVFVLHKHEVNDLGLGHQGNAPSHDLQLSLWPTLSGEYEATQGSIYSSLSTVESYLATKHEQGMRNSIWNWISSI